VFDAEDLYICHITPNNGHVQIFSITLKDT
jgi:hypothetical protein